MGDAETSDRLRATGERIDALLAATGSGGAAARERAEELVRLTADLYGAGLERILDIVYDGGGLGDEVLAALAADDLVASLLLVHGLHPYDVAQRVEQALDSVRPYLGSHGGDVELVGVSDEGVVRLRMLGSCDGCPSSSVTLTLAVESAIEAAAPEVSRHRGRGGSPRDRRRDADPARVAALTARLAGHRASWEALPQVADLASGQTRTVAVGPTPILVCRLGTELFAYRDRCGRCDGSLEGAALSRRLGAAVGEAVLRCPRCGAHYDVRRAGVGLDDDAAEQGLRLVPVPLLTDGGVTSVAVSVQVPA